VNWLTELWGSMSPEERSHTLAKNQVLGHERLRAHKAEVEANRCRACGVVVPSTTRETCPPCELRVWRRAQ